MDRVRRVINEWDPIDLLEFCPKDEYKNEIFAIQIRGRNVNDEITLAKIIYDVFINSFDDAFTCSLNDCIKIAQKILNT